MTIYLRLFAAAGYDTSVHVLFGLMCQYLLFAAVIFAAPTMDVEFQF